MQLLQVWFKIAYSSFLTFPEEPCMQVSDSQGYDPMSRVGYLTTGINHLSVVVCINLGIHPFLSLWLQRIRNYLGNRGIQNQLQMANLKLPVN